MGNKKKGRDSHGVTAAAQHRRVPTDSVSGSGTVGKAGGKDLERFASWLRRQWEARYAVTLHDRQDFEQDVALLVLEEMSKDPGLTLANASARFAKIGFRRAGEAHFRRCAVVHLTDHALTLVRAMRAGKLDEVEGKRRQRTGWKGKKYGQTGAVVLSRYDVFSSEPANRVSIAA